MGCETRCVGSHLLYHGLCRSGGGACPGNWGSLGSEDHGSLHRAAVKTPGSHDRRAVAYRSQDSISPPSVVGVHGGEAAGQSERGEGGRARKTPVVKEGSTRWAGRGLGALVPRRGGATGTS